MKVSDGSSVHLQNASWIHSRERGKDWGLKFDYIYSIYILWEHLHSFGTNLVGLLKKQPGQANLIWIWMVTTQG